MRNTSTLADRRGLWAFMLGVVAVTVGVLMHLPMFLMARHNHFNLSGMPIGWDMILGMIAIIGGVAIAAYGLLPRNIANQLAASQDIVVTPPEDAPFNSAHWKLLSVLVIALVIDIMKPATLGFTLPGMMSEYEVSKAAVSAFPFSALAGTVIGSIIWGVLADIYGRKATILLSAVMFVGTSICGAMPSLAWNVGMCFMMGVAAGGMLPVTYALLAEMMPSKHRGWSLVLVGGLGAVGGYFAASIFSALLQPYFGWRILWILNLPTGLSLVLLGAFIPESAKFLLSRGRREEARRVMERFGSKARKTRPAERTALDQGAAVALTGSAFFGKLFALSLAAICFSLINFGLLLWLPADLISKGYSVGLSSKLLAEFGPDCLSDGFHRRLSLQPLEHQMVGHGLLGGHAGGTGRRLAARMDRIRKSGAAGGAAYCRYQRANRNAVALHRGKLSAAHSRADNGDCGSLHQGGRHGRPTAGDVRVGAVARNRVASHHRPDHRGADSGWHVR